MRFCLVEQVVETFFTVFSFEICQVNAFTCAECRGYQVVVLHVLIKDFDFIGKPVACDTVHISLDVANIPFAGSIAVTMSRSTKADVGNLMPIAAVVQTSVAWPGKVADFIVLIACFGELVYKHLIHGKACFFVNIFYFLLLLHVEKRCTFFIHQTVS